MLRELGRPVGPQVDASDDPPDAPGAGGTTRSRLRSRRWLLVACVVACAIVAAGAGVAVRYFTGAPPARPTLVRLMGLSPVPSKPAPGFTLTDQHGRVRSLASFRGKAVALYFMDDRCTDVCPIVARELALADRELGATASKVALVGVEVNPKFTAERWVRKFDAEHGLSRLPNWYYFTGTVAALAPVWRAYNVATGIDPKTGDDKHTTLIEFIGPHGRERAEASPQAFLRPNGTGYLPPATVSEGGHGIATQLRRILPKH